MRVGSAQGEGEEVDLHAALAVHVDPLEEGLHALVGQGLHLMFADLFKIAVKWNVHRKALAYSSLSLDAFVPLVDCRQRCHHIRIEIKKLGNGDGWNNPDAHLERFVSGRSTANGGQPCAVILVGVGGLHLDRG